MTKQEFMEILNRELGDIPAEEKAQFLRYCTEMIEDRMEEGMTEEEAVGSREELDELIRAFREENGFGRSGIRLSAEQMEQLNTLKEDVQQLRGDLIASAEGLRSSAENLRDSVYAENGRGDGVDFWSVSASQVRSLTVDVSEVRILFHEATDGQITLRYPVDPERLEITKTLSAEGDMTLKIRAKEQSILFGAIRWRWMRSSRLEPLEAWVPKDFAGEVRLSNSNCSINVDHPGLPGKVDLTSSNAKIEFASDVSGAGEIVCRTSNARIAFANLQANKVNLRTSNSRISGGSLAVSNTAELVTSNARIQLEKINAPEASLVTNNGTIALDHGDCRSLTLATSNGSIHAALAGNIRDYGIESRTSNGDNDLPRSMPGGERMLKATTSNGSIRVKFEG